MSYFNKLTFSGNESFTAKDNCCLVLVYDENSRDLVNVNVNMTTVYKDVIEEQILKPPIDYSSMTENQKKIWSQYQIFVQLVSNAFPKPDDIGRFSGTNDLFFSIYREEGLHKRYKGLKQLWDQFHEEVQIK